MKLKSNVSKLMTGLAAVALMALASTKASAQSTAEAADRAYEMANKYAGMGYYMTPTKEGKAGFGTTIQFEMPVNRGLDYVFIMAGDRYCEDVDVWIEIEDTGNTIVRDTRKVSNGLAGVRWRSDFNGTVNIVVHFARVTSRCGWSALVGRRGTANAPDNPSISTLPGTPIPSGGSGADKPGETPVVQ